MNNELLDLVNYKVSRSKETLLEAETIFQAGFYNGAVNRMYYSCYYMVSALLLLNNIKTQTHKGIRQQFGHHFIQTGIVSKEMGRYFSDLFDRRHTGDYDDFVICDKVTCSVLLTKANEFISEVEKIVVS